MDLFKDRLKIFLIYYFLHPIIGLIWRSCKIEWEGLEAFSEEVQKGPCILVAWHNHLMGIPYALFRKTPKISYKALLSKSRDGDLLACLEGHFDNAQVMRVAHDQKAGAIRALAKACEEHVVVITPDGPRGPRHLAKPGAAVTAYMAKAKLIPFSWVASKSWILPTWDRLELPKPFSKVRFSIGQGINVRRDQLEAASKITENLLQ